MMLTMLKSKIHRATVTEADLNYTGSLTIDRDLMDAAGMLVHEKVLVVNNNNGARFETYIIEGKRGSGIMCLNGAAARHGHPGDIIIAMCFASMTEEEARVFKPKTVYVDAANKVTHVEFSAA